MAELIVGAWERRCAAAATEGIVPPPARPVLMHSNLDSVDEVLQVAQLPDRIRPRWLGFGSLADGFLPFLEEKAAPAASGGATGGAAHPKSIQMASLVMKAVQARAPALGPPPLPCAGKLGDDAAHSKVQVDPRLPVEQQQQVAWFMQQLAAATEVRDGSRVSAALAEAYHAVTRDRILAEAPG